MRKIVAALVFAAALLHLAASAADWQPNRPVEFVVAAGAGGGSDIFARTVQSIIVKYNLLPQPIVVLNKGGGSGAEGFGNICIQRLLTQTMMPPATSTPVPGEATLPVGNEATITPIPVVFNSSARVLYQSPTLGIQFSYPAAWYLRETSGSVTVTSFDPANPPHKLDGQTKPQA